MATVPWEDDPPAGSRMALRETVTVDRLPEAPAVLDVWHPLPPDGPGQDVLDVSVASDAPFQPGHDPDYGNPMRHVRLQGRLPERLTFRVDYLVDRVNRRSLAGLPASCEGPGAVPEPAGRPGGDPRRLAARLVRGESDELRRAGILLRHTRECPGSALQRARLLVELLRAAGQRARLVAGHRPAAAAGGGDVVLDSHYWAEVFVSELGWLPADPEGDRAFRLGLDHVVRGRGDHLLLLPVQRGGRLPALSETYAELNGRRHPVRTRLTMRPAEPVSSPAPVPACPPPRPDLAELVHRELPRLAPATDTIRLARGATLTLDSCDGQWLFVLLDGQVRLSRLSPSGRKLELGLFGAPELFLGSRLLHGVGEAVSDAVLVALSREQVRQLTGHQPEFGSLVLETLNDRFIESDERMEYLAYHSLASRVAMALLRVCDPEGVVDGLTHQQIGDIVGAYRETVTKVLHELKRAGMVRLAHRRIEVLDPLALTRLQDA
jgi:CRP-like cAMP-binding protein